MNKIQKGFIIAVLAAALAGCAGCAGCSPSKDSGNKPAVTPTPTAEVQPTPTAAPTAAPSNTPDSSAAPQPSNNETPAPAEKAIGKVKVLVNKLTVRTGVTAADENLGYAENGKTYEVYEMKNSGSYTWYRIGQNKWIADNGSWCAFTTNNPAGTDVKTVDEITGGANTRISGAGGTVRVNVNGLRVRTNHSASAPVVGNVTNGKSYPVYGVYRDDPEYDWVLVGTDRWIATDKSWSWLTSYPYDGQGGDAKPSPAPAPQPGQNTVTVQVNEINIRNTPSTTGQVVGSVKYGQTVNCYEVKKNNDYDWIRIGNNQWIATDKGWTWVTANDGKGGDAKPAPAPAPQPGQNTVTVQVGEINVRNAPSITGAVVGSVKYGQTVNCYEVKKNDDYDWIRIGDGKWIATDKGWTWVTANDGKGGDADPKPAPAPQPGQNTVTVLANEINIRNTPDLSGQVVGSVKKGETYNCYEVMKNVNYDWIRIGDNKWIATDKGWTWVKANEGKGGDAKPAPTPQPGQNTVTVQVGEINIRSTPSTTGQVVGSVKYGQTVNCYEVKKNDDYDWIRIGDNKWIATDKGWTWVKANEGKGGDAKPAPQPKQNTITVQANEINIRNTPDLSGKVVGSVKKGETYNCYEVMKNVNYDWIRIGDNKWIATDKGWTWVKAN